MNQLIIDRNTQIRQPINEPSCSFMSAFIVATQTGHSFKCTAKMLIDLELPTSILTIRLREFSIMVIDITSAIGLIIALVGCQTMGASKSLQQYIGYRATENSLTEVYEVARNHVSYGGPSILGPARFQSEFGGPIASCADAQFHCFSSDLQVAVPRDGIAATWTAGGHECRVLDFPTLSPDRTVRILCRTSEEQSVEFTYSRQRGIVSFRRQCPGCYGGEYVLVTDSGLFASPYEH